MQFFWKKNSLQISNLMAYNHLPITLSEITWRPFTFPPPSSQSDTLRNFTVKWFELQIKNQAWGQLSFYENYTIPSSGLYFKLRAYCYQRLTEMNKLILCGWVLIRKLKLRLINLMLSWVTSESSIRTLVCFDSQSPLRIPSPQRSISLSLCLWPLTWQWRRRSQGGAFPTPGATWWRSPATTTTQQRTRPGRRSASSSWRSRWGVWGRSWRQCSRSVGGRRDSWRGWRRHVRHRGPLASCRQHLERVTWFYQNTYATHSKASSNKEERVVKVSNRFLLVCQQPGGL